MEKRYRLRSMPYAQANVGIEEIDGEYTAVRLYSYKTLVAVIDVVRRPATLYCTGIYSRTTARHINRFTTEFCGRNLYYECKEAVSPARGFADGRVNARIAMFDVLSMAYWYSEHGKRFNGKY